MKRSSVFALALFFTGALAYADQPPSAPDASPPPTGRLPPAPPLPSASSSASAEAPAVPLPAPPPSASAAAPPAPSASASAIPAAPAPSSEEASPPPPVRPPASWIVAAELGVQHLSIAALKGTDASILAIDGAPTATLLGAAIALWLRPFTLGARLHFAHTSLINYWNVGPEIGARFAVAGVEPYGFLGFGYASVAGLGQVLRDGGPIGSAPSTGNLGAHGYEARVGVGLSIPISAVFSVGGLVTGEIVHLGYSIDGASTDAATTGVATSAAIVLDARF